MKIYLHQFLSRTGLFRSKEELRRAIKAGEIKIEDKVVLNPLYQFRENKKTVYWKGKPIKARHEKIYIILNKPPNFLSSKLTREDVRLRKKSVFDIIENEKKIDDQLKRTLFCVGRLDEDSTGLLIITNDGDLSAKITEPKRRIGKTYFIELIKPLKEEEIEKIEQGITIELEENGSKYQYLTGRSKIELFGDKKAKIIIHEGKKREVKRIFKAVGNKVVKLERAAIGRLNLNELKLNQGEYIITDKKFIEEKIAKG